MEAKFSTLNLFKLTSYGKFGFSRPYLDGNKLAKGMYLAGKVRDREEFIKLYQGSSIILFFKLLNYVKSAVKGLILIVL